MKPLRYLGTAALALLVASAAFAAACGDDDDDDDTGPTTAATPGGGVPGNLTKVAVSDNQFTPANLQVPAGATVTWEWSGGAPHSVVGSFDGEAITSPQLTGTGVFLHAFQKAGTFNYMCGVHGQEMSGTITIR